MSGGGGGGGGGMVVGGPSPAAAYGAGYLNSQAAIVAGQQAEQAVRDAINSVNRNYQQARYDVQPYRTEGVQALNQLNQYLGLNPYNPGAAPTAPKENNLENAMAKITKSDIKNYINQNIGFNTDNGGSYYGWYKYSGAGADQVGKNFNGATGQWETNQISKNPSDWYNNPTIQNAVRRELAQDYMQQNQEAYDISMQGYQRDLDEYNQNKAMYDKYSAEGPYSSEQISDKITNLPGYQAQLGQGIDAIQKASGAGGYLGSGRLLKELNSYGQNTLSTFYNNELSRLAGLAGMGQQAASQSAQTSMNQGNALAGLQSSIGDIRANAGMASANALSQALLAANQQYKVIGGNDGGGGGMGGIGQALGLAGSLLGGGGGGGGLLSFL